MNRDDIFGIIFFAFIGSFLLFLGLAGIWWFGLCYFFAVIAFAIVSIVWVSLVNKSFGIYLIGIIAILLGILPHYIYNHYGAIYNYYGKPVIFLDVDSSMPTLIGVETFILFCGGLFLIGRDIYMRIIENKKEISKKEYSEEELSRINSIRNANVVRVNIEIARIKEKAAYIKEKYGEITKELWERRILICEDSKIVLINEEPYSFSDIMNIELVDNEKQIFQKQSSTTKVSTGNMLGRAVVGGVLLGGVGAIIGGATAKKETIINAPEVHTTHDYNIYITVNSLSNPLITLSIGKNEQIAREISSFLAVIIERNNR
jgi:hypothetical protein